MVRRYNAADTSGILRKLNIASVTPASLLFSLYTPSVETWLPQAQDTKIQVSIYYCSQQQKLPKYPVVDDKINNGPGFGLRKG